MAKLLLHIAAGTGDLQTLQELLAPPEIPKDDDDDDDSDFQPKDWRAKINKRNCMGETPLHIACLAGHFEAAQLLIQNGAKLFPIHVTRNHKLRILHSAIQATILSPNPVTRSSSVAFTKLLASENPSHIFEVDWQDRTPFHLAAYCGALGSMRAMVEILESSPSDMEGQNGDAIQKKIQMILSSEDVHGYTPLHSAAAGRRPLCASYLISLGANVNAGDHNGCTPLHIAVISGSSSVFQILLRAGASLDLENVYRHSPRFLAQKYHRTQLISLQDEKQHHFESFKDSTIVWDPEDSYDAESLLRTCILYDKLGVLHVTSPFVSKFPICHESVPENTERLEVLIGDRGVLLGNEFDGLEKIICESFAPLGDVLRVHDYGYIRHLREFCSRIPKPMDFEKRIRVEAFDEAGDTPVSYFSAEASFSAAGVIIEAVDRVLQGKSRNAFCAIRPPGHHAGPYGLDHICSEGPPSQGFCLLNNIAIGASYARNVYRHKGIRKIAIIDFDVHHGNGTEAIVRCLGETREKEHFISHFNRVSLDRIVCRPWLDETDPENVLFVSVHGYGHTFYPQSGETSDLHENEGEHGGILNIGLPSSILSRKQWYRCWQHRLLPAIDRFTPDIIFLSAGFDAHFSDSINADHIGLHEEDYTWLTTRIQSIANKHCQGRVVSALEGGYAINGHQVSPFARAVAAHVKSLANGGNLIYEEEDNFKYLPLTMIENVLMEGSDALSTELDPFGHPTDEMQMEMPEDTEKAFHEAAMEYELGEHDPYTENPPFPAGFHADDESLAATGNLKEPEQVSSSSSDRINPEDYMESKEEVFEGESIDSQGVGKENEQSSEVVVGEVGREGDDGVGNEEEVYDEGDVEYQQNEGTEEEAEVYLEGNANAEAVVNEGNVEDENVESEAHVAEEEGGEYVQGEEEYDDGAHYAEDDEESRGEHYEDERFSREGYVEIANESYVEHRSAVDHEEIHVESVETVHENDLVDESQLNDVSGDVERGLSGDVDGVLFETDGRILDEEDRVLVSEEEAGIVDSASRKRTRDEDPLYTDNVNELPQKRIRN